MMREKIKKLIKESLRELGVPAAAVSLEHPDDISHGDYSANAALVYCKELEMNPRELAEKILAKMKEKEAGDFNRIEIAGPGFINFFLSREFFAESVAEIRRQEADFGKNYSFAGRKVMVEYTDPNPFKEFHIGHLMSNAIGESIARLLEWRGAEVKRACYQGDVGLHVAKAIYGMTRVKEKTDYIAYLGEAYAFGADAYEKEPAAKKEIEAVNKKVFEKSDEKTRALYARGREESIRHFETLYRKLGTKFDYNFFESETGEVGKKIVEEFLPRGVFEKSRGAIIFPGEKHSLHSRVFINSQGLPTYEAKELGLAEIKYEKYRYDQSIVITGNEVNDYFKVLLSAMALVFPELAKKTKHLSHGMLRLPTGKMSSRTGNVITGESLISAVEAMVREKIEERELLTEEKNKIAEQVAIGAIKYSILRQAVGGDIIFDFQKSISFEGDSGPYLQYAAVRARSVLAKAEAEKIKEAAPPSPAPPEVSLPERLLYRFPEVAARAAEEFAPHLIVTYLTELAAAWNGYYSATRIVVAGDPTSPYRAALARAFFTVMKNGLFLLGIETPEKM